MFRDLQWLKEHRNRRAEAKQHPGQDSTIEFENGVGTGRPANSHGDSIIESDGSSILAVGGRCRAEAHGESMLDEFSTEATDPREMRPEVAEQLSRDLDLSGVESILDISGLDGTISIVLCRNNPALHSTVFDRPDTAEGYGAGGSFVTVQRPEAGCRVTFMRSSSHATWLEVLKSRHDAVLMSHTWSDEERQVLEPAAPMLYELAFEGLRPGGLVVVHDSSADAFSIVPQTMEASGFRDIQRISIADRDNGRFLVGRKAFRHLEE